MTQYLQLLRIPAQRWLLLASIPGNFADWLDYVAVVTLLAYGWSQGPLVLAALAVAFALPYVVVGPFAGLLVDRLPLKPVLVWSNLGRALCTGLLIVAGQPIAVLLLVFLRCAVDSAFNPAKQAALQQITDAALLPTANGAHQSVNQASKIVGPALGGLLLTVLPAQAIFGVNSALSVAAALLLTGLHLPAASAARGIRTTLWGDLSAGIGEFRRNRKLAAALGFACAAFFSFFLYDALIAMLARQFGFPTSAFGLAVTFSGLGGLVGALIAGSLQLGRPTLVMGLAALANGPATLALALCGAFGVPLPLWLFFGLMMVMGSSTSFMLVPYRTALQQETAPERLGRVVAAGEAVTMLAMMGAPFAGSLIASLAGVPAAFAAGGVLLVLIGLVALWGAVRERG